MTLKKRRSGPYGKKMVEKKKVATVLLVVFSHMFESYTKDVYIIKSMSFLKIGFQNNNAVFARFSIYKIRLDGKKMLLAHDKKDVCGAILTDLSKTFDCISHNLLIAKLHAYGFDRNALKVIHDYLSGRSQNTKVTSSFNDFSDVKQSVP